MQNHCLSIQKKNFMKSTISDFCVFILSHKRPQCETLQMLKKYNYSGDYRIVLSTDDDQIDEYKKSILDDKIIVFDKMKVRHLCDTMISSHDFNPNGSIYARAFISQKAKEMGLDYYCMADDDITKIYHREDVNKKMKQKEITNIDDVFLSLIQFLSIDERIASINPALDDGFFGGINGNYKKTATRMPFQFIVFKTQNTRKWRGIRSEDYNLSCTNTDLLYFTYWHLSIASPKMTTNKGGIDYKKHSSLNPSMFMWLAHPAGIKMVLNQKKKLFINKIFPKVISDKYKK